MIWYVYIVVCSKDGTLYTGISNNVAKRIKNHNAGKGAKYTRTRRPVVLLKQFKCANRSEASKLEYKIKQLTRKQKIEFMSTFITDDCINCAACEPECPNGAISAGDEIFIIDPNLCNECVGFHNEEACQVVCPVACCLPDPNNVESEQILVERALRLHPEDEELKKRIDSGTFPSLKRK